MKNINTVPSGVDPGLGVLGNTGLGKEVEETHGAYKVVGAIRYAHYLSSQEAESGTWQKRDLDKVIEEVRYKKSYFRLGQRETIKKGQENGMDFTRGHSHQKDSDPL